MAFSVIHELHGHSTDLLISAAVLQNDRESSHVKRLYFAPIKITQMYGEEDDVPSCAQCSCSTRGPFLRHVTISL